MLALVVGSASAATYNLRAGATTVNLRDARTEWGYALVSYDLEDGAGPGPGTNSIMVPGPTIYVPAGPGSDHQPDQQPGRVHLHRGPGPEAHRYADAHSAVASPPSPTRPRHHRHCHVLLVGCRAQGRHLSSTTAAATPPSRSTWVSTARWWSMPTRRAATSGLAAYPGVCYDRDIVVIY